MKLSILMPVFNESQVLEAAVKRVLDVDFAIETELVIVDDGSTDGTRDHYPAWAQNPRVRIHLQDTNQGKGSAIRKAAELATGDYIIMCDADLEYSPEEIPSLLKPVIDGVATVVYGTRTFGSHNSYSYLYVLGNRAVTTVANILFNCYLSDLETCFKLLPLQTYRSMNIRSDGFGMEAEITAKLLGRGIRPFEVPISYNARSRQDGKKLTWKDGVAAIAILGRNRLATRRGRVATG